MRATGFRPVRLADGARIVLKVGSSSLTRPDGGLDLNRIDIVAGLVAGLRERGHDVVLVSSGAVAAGLVPLGMTERPGELRLLQAAASVGQGHLVSRWQTAMSAYGVVTAQVLLTAQDVAVRTHYRTVRATFDALLSMGVVPIVNENDAVATTEFTLGDNDRLAALVAHLVTADALVLLTDVDGMWTARPGTPGARPVRYVEAPEELGAVDVSGRGGSLGTGGMRTKLQAATIACASGTATIIAAADDAPRLLGQREVPADLGTWFAPTVDGPRLHSRGARDDRRRCSAGHHRRQEVSSPARCHRRQWGLRVRGGGGGRGTRRGRGPGHLPLLRHRARGGPPGTQAGGRRRTRSCRPRGAPRRPRRAPSHRGRVKIRLPSVRRRFAGRSDLRRCGEEPTAH